MLAILDLLQLLLIGHLSVELLVLIDVLLFFNLGLVGDTGNALLVLLLELGELLLVGDLGGSRSAAQLTLTGARYSVS